jgi:hypothetical protein
VLPLSQTQEGSGIFYWSEIASVRKGTGKYHKYPLATKVAVAFNNLVEERSILQVPYIFPWKEDRYRKSLWQVRNIWPPKRIGFCPFLKQPQAQSHCPQFLCHMLPTGLDLLLNIGSSPNFAEWNYFLKSEYRIETTPYTKRKNVV